MVPSGRRDVPIEPRRTALVDDRDVDAAVPVVVCEGDTLGVVRIVAPARGAEVEEALAGAVVHEELVSLLASGPLLAADDVPRGEVEILPAVEIEVVAPDAPCDRLHGRALERSGDSGRRGDIGE